MRPHMKSLFSIFLGALILGSLSASAQECRSGRPVCNTEKEKQGLCVLPQTLQSDVFGSTAEFLIPSEWLVLQIEGKNQWRNNQVLTDILGEDGITRMEACHWAQRLEVDKLLAAAALEQKKIPVSKELSNGRDWFMRWTQQCLSKNTHAGLKFQVWTNLSLTQKPEKYDPSALVFENVNKRTGFVLLSGAAPCNVVVSSEYSSDGTCKIVDIEKELQKFSAPGNEELWEDTAPATKILFY